MYMQVGNIPDDKKIDLSSIGSTAEGTDGPLIGKEEEYQYSDQKDPNALLELVHVIMFKELIKQVLLL